MQNKKIRIFGWLANLIQSHPVNTWRAHALFFRDKAGSLIWRPRRRITNPAVQLAPFYGYNPYTPCQWNTPAPFTQAVVPPLPAPLAKETDRGAGNAKASSTGSSSNFMNPASKIARPTISETAPLSSTGVPVQRPGNTGDIEAENPPDGVQFGFPASPDKSLPERPYIDPRSAKEPKPEKE